MRILLDTCAVIDMLTDWDNMSSDVRDIIDNPENMLFASFETMRELVVHFNNKKLLSKHWKKAEEMLKAVEEEIGIEFLPLRRDVGYTYSRLCLNEAQNHYDPSDHIIISQAITEHLTLLSSDKKFAFYCKQGLLLIEY